MERRRACGDAQVVLHAVKVLLHVGVARRLLLLLWGVGEGRGGGAHPHTPTVNGEVSMSIHTTWVRRLQRQIEALELRVCDSRALQPKRKTAPASPTPRWKPIPYGIG